MCSLLEFIVVLLSSFSLSLVLRCLAVFMRIKLTMYVSYVRTVKRPHILAVAKLLQLL